jgi:molybdate-binding protein
VGSDINRERGCGTAMLFEAKQRTRTAPKKPGEGEFAFYDSSARPEYDFYGDLVDGWIAELLEADRAEIVSAVQKGRSDSI